jgi:CO dehydrogenase maturation factor
MKPLEGLRILFSGKGGSGKSSVITLLARELVNREYKIVLIDGDASNPNGLCRLSCGKTDRPLPLLDYFGGRQHVDCPSDNPAPLTRLNDAEPVTERHIRLNEIPEQFYLKKGNLYLFQSGKTNQANEGCDGPMSKITRDFIVEEGYVTLVDTEAGIEHFGRGIEQNVDMVFIIVDGTFESIEIAAKISDFCWAFRIDKVRAIINKAHSPGDEKYIAGELQKRKVKLLGSIPYDRKIELAGLMGAEIYAFRSKKHIDEIIRGMEKLFSVHALH